MEVATRPNLTAPPDPTPEPAKLTIDRFVDGSIACLRFSGTIDESFEGKKLAQSVKAQVLVLDLGQVKKISSFGIREWVDFVGGAGKQVKQLLLIECAPKVVDQLNMVANFAGDGRVFSFYAPFRCDYCDSEHRVLLQVDRDWEAIRAMKLPDKPCPSCSEAMYFDEDPATFFSYVIGQGTFELEPDVAAFLAAKLDYAVSDGTRKLRVDKAIDGRVTFVRLAGDLDGAFPRDKLAEGLEGTVIIDVGGVSRIEPAGAAEWRSFMHQVEPVVEAVHLIGVSPPFLEKLGRKDDLGDKGSVLSLVLPYSCAMCATTTGQIVDVEQHHDVLRFASAPELKCAQCKAPLACVAAEPVMAILPGLPTPVTTPDLRKTIDKLRERKPPKKPSTSMAAAAPAPRATTALWIPFAAAVLAVALGAGAFLAWRAWGEDDAGAERLGKVVASSPGGRPAWIGQRDTPGTASCTDTMEMGIACVGVSSASGSQVDSEEEAAEAAQEAMAEAIAARVTDPKWRAVVAPIWAEARKARLAQLARDPDSAQARRSVRETRHAIAAVLAQGPIGKLQPTTDAYWEEHAGKQFVAFARWTVPAAGVQKAIAAYTQSATILGATVVPVYPLIAWRWPEATHGVVVVGLEPGRFQQLGLAQHYVVLGVGGKDIEDPAHLGRVVGEELARLEKAGGTLELEVQADDPRPRKFSSAVKSVAPPDEGSDRDRDRDRDRGSGKRHERGGVNVWDRYDNGKKPNPDDPRQ